MEEGASGVAEGDSHRAVVSCHGVDTAEAIVVAGEATLLIKAWDYPSWTHDFDIPVSIV